MKNRKYRLTLLSQYNERALQFEFIKQITYKFEGGFTNTQFETEDGRLLSLSTKDTIFIEELKNDI